MPDLEKKLSSKQEQLLQSQPQLIRELNLLVYRDIFEALKRFTTSLLRYHVERKHVGIPIPFHLLCELSAL